MPAVTRSRKQTKKGAEFCVLIDKTPRNISAKPVRTAGKDKPKPKPKPKQKALRVAPAPPPEAKSKAKYKRPAKASSIRVEAEGENAAQRSEVGGQEDSLQRVLSTELPDVFATPPRSHPPLRPPKLPEHRSHDPKTTIPPQFHHDGTPSPEPRRRRSQVGPPRASSLLPPSSPIQLSSSPARQFHDDPVEGGSIFLSAHLPGSPSQFRTPTRRNRKRKRTPLSKPHLQSEGEVNNDDLFAHGVIDDLDEREDSVDWENAGSDKENHGGPPEFPGSDKLALSMPFTSERGILQPREASHTPARSGGSDPFGIIAAERLLKARRAETILGEPEAGPSNRHRGPRRPLGELPADEVASITHSVEIAASRSPSLPSPASPYRRYSDSEIEDLYLPASPPTHHVNASRTRTRHLRILRRHPWL
ncbi:hypothetical protein BC826DRAFT_414421 [Russula brevipes]|nr:hypothetical protein BC826DRAFT_414421 [Russula brevipes]